MRLARRLPILAVLALATSITASSANAQDNTAAARQAYDKGAAAYDAKDYATAAPELARADELAPNGTVLELALQAAIRADNAPLVMDLAQRVEERVPSSTPLYTRAKEARTKFEKSAARIVIRCPAPATFCKASLDGHNLAIDVPRWTTAGGHSLDIDADGVAEHLSMMLPPGQTSELAPTPRAKPAPLPAVTQQPSTPPPAQDPSPPRPVEKTVARGGGLSSTWFWIGSAATAIAGGFLIASAIDTQNKHDSFGKTPTPSGKTDGESAQLRTNVLVGVTAGLGVSTGILGAFFVGWSQGPSAAVVGRF